MPPLASAFLNGQACVLPPFLPASPSATCLPPAHLPGTAGLRETLGPVSVLSPLKSAVSSPLKKHLPLTFLPLCVLDRLNGTLSASVLVRGASDLTTSLTLLFWGH